MRLFASFAIAAVFAGAAATAAPGPSAVMKLKGSNFASSARVSLAAARSTALTARPGSITDQELEKETGGSGLRYSLDIKDRGKTFEVGVDAVTGKVLENKAEGRNPD